MKKEWMALAVSSMLLGCTTPTSVPHDEADSVRMDYHGIINIDQCEYKGEVTGSEGHWYSYLFYPNDTLIQGAMNELKTNAIQLGCRYGNLYPTSRFFNFGYHAWYRLSL